MHEYTIVKKSHMDAFHFVNYLLYLPQKQHHKHAETIVQSAENK